MQRGNATRITHKHLDRSYKCSKTKKKPNMNNIGVLHLGPYSEKSLSAHVGIHSSNCHRNALNETDWIDLDFPIELSNMDAPDFKSEISSTRL